MFAALVTRGLWSTSGSGGTEYQRFEGLVGTLDQTEVVGVLAMTYVTATVEVTSGTTSVIGVLSPSSAAVALVTTTTAVVGVVEEC